MKFSELTAAFADRFPGKMTQSEIDAWVEDSKAAGLGPGPNLHDAFDKWRVSWTLRSPPRPAEFMTFYTERAIVDRHEDQPTYKPDGSEWARTVLLEFPEGAEAYERGLLYEVALWCIEHPGDVPDRREFPAWQDHLADLDKRIQGGHIGQNIFTGIIAKSWATRLDNDRRTRAWYEAQKAAEQLELSDG